MLCNISSAALELTAALQECNISIAALLYGLQHIKPTTKTTDTQLDYIYEGIKKDDAAWILANAFLILTMQTGFGMLEAGCVSAKNVANIMVKNVVDVSIGGLTYWTVGYALSFGRPSNPFCGFGDFFATARDQETSGSFYSHYVFQFSFATAATTIVSGAIAERMKFTSYMIYSCLNVFIYALPVAWAWNDVGFLKQLLFYDYAGAAVVHLSGGASALAAAWILGPRLGKFDSKDGEGVNSMSSPVTALTGTFMLWWAWLAFNCGSSYGLNGDLWKIAAKSGVCTINGSIGGSLVGLSLTVLRTWDKGSYYFNIGDLIQSVLGGLVGVTACCSVVTPAESFLVGSIGGFIAVMGCPLLEKLKIDDPVGAIPVHMGAALWSTLSIGIFGNDDFGLLGGQKGLLRGGGCYLLGVQVLGAVIITTWSGFLTYLFMFLMKLTIGIRMDIEHELLGADWVDHRVRSEDFAEKLQKALEETMKKGEGKGKDAAEKVIKELLTRDTQEVSSRIEGIAGKEDRPEQFRRRSAYVRKNMAWITSASQDRSS